MKMLGNSHIGLTRRINQDNFLIEEKDGVQLMMVCDGMGGANAGEVASLIAVQAMHNTFLSADFTHVSKDYLTAWLKNAFIKMNRQVFDEAQLNEDYLGMGTTAVAFLVYKDIILCANVGDSRAYILNTNNKLIQITEDHSLVNELIKSKRISPEQAKTHPQRSVLTNVCGVVEKVVIDIFDVKEEIKGLLCCSDGLHNMLDDKKIESILKQKRSIEHKVDQLIQDSNQAGGYDNITVTLAWKVK